MPSCLTQQLPTPLDHWQCAVVSGTKMSAADPVSCKLGPPHFGLCLVNLKWQFLVALFKPSLKPFFFFASGLMNLLKETTAIWKYNFQERVSMATTMHSLVIYIKVKSIFILFISVYLTGRCNFNQNDGCAINNLSSGSCSVALVPMVQPGPHPWPCHQFTTIPHFWHRPLQTAILHRWIMYAYIAKAIERYEEAEIDVHLLTVSLWFLCQSEHDTQE